MWPPNVVILFLLRKPGRHKYSQSEATLSLLTLSTLRLVSLIVAKCLCSNRQSGCGEFEEHQQNGQRKQFFSLLIPDNDWTGPPDLTVDFCLRELNEFETSVLNTPTPFLF